jgi:hypothetical protein
MVVEVLIWGAFALGVGLALYGGWILLTGRAPVRTRQAFRSETEAGLYSLCNGSGLALLALGSRFDQIALLVLALLFCGLAFVKFRPRRQPGA